MRRALILAFLLLLGSAFLGATVFHEPLANAANNLTSVLVTNSKTSPVPVQEVNTDANGNIKVHEQGTANVNVTNTTVPVHEQGSATVHVDNNSLSVTPQDSILSYPAGFSVAVGTSQTIPFLGCSGNGCPIKASLITVTSMRGSGTIWFSSGTDIRLVFRLEPGNDIVVPLAQPLTLTSATLNCDTGSTINCGAEFNVVGT